MLNSIFDQMDFGPLQEFLDDDDITDVSYSNGGQVWLKTLSKGIYQVDRPNINNAFMEKLAFQCSNVMGKTFNMAHPFLDAESAELRMNFVHDSIATNGIACLIRKTPAKIRLNKDKLINEQYVTAKLHDFLIKCIHGHANIIVAGETGSGKTELVKYLASKTKEDEKIISIEDTLELHLDKIFPQRDIVAMKTNNIASYTEALVACMRQNPIWILLAEVRSGEAVMAVRNSISSGHHVMSTIHADRATAIPMRMYSLLESSQDIEQFVGSIHRYVQIGIYVKGYFSKRLGRFQREIIEVCEFYVDDDDNQAKCNLLYQKSLDGKVVLRNPTKYLRNYLAIGNVEVAEDEFNLGPSNEGFEDTNIEAAENAAKNGGEGAEEASQQAPAATEEKKEETQGPTEEELRPPTNEEDPFGMNDEKTSEASASQSEKTDAQVMADASGVTAQGGNTAAPQPVAPVQPQPIPTATAAQPVPAQPVAAQPAVQAAAPVQQVVAVPQQKIEVPVAPGQQPVNPLAQAQAAIPKPVVDGVMMKAPQGGVQAVQNLQTQQAAATTTAAA
jgi:pilus assembly protein CpaF